MQLHSQSNEGEQGIAGLLACHDLHRPGSSAKLFVEPLDDVGGSKRDPLLLGEVEESEARSQALLQTFHRGWDMLFPSFLEFLEELPGLVPRRGIEDRSHPVRYGLFEFPGDLGRDIPCHMNLAALDLRFGKLFLNPKFVKNFYLTAPK